MTVIFLSVWRSIPLINGLYRNFSTLNSIKNTLDEISNGKIYIFKDVFSFQDLNKDTEDKFLQTRYALHHAPQQHVQEPH